MQRDVVIVEACRPSAGRRTGARYGLVTMCCGGGLGTGTLIERL